MIDAPVRSSLWILLSFALAMSTGFSPSANFDLQGHRGCRALLPENSIAGFIKAIDLGVSTLELDVVVSADQQLVVSHEAWMSSEICSDPTGKRVAAREEKESNLYRMSYAEIARWDCGRNSHPRFPRQIPTPVHKPLLSEVFEACEAHLRNTGRNPVAYNIEIKSEAATDNVFHPAPAEFIKLLLAALPQEIAPQRITLQSFDIRPLQLLHHAKSPHRLSLLVDEQEDADAKLLSLGFVPAVLSPHYKMVDVALLTRFHARHMRVIPWTVNDPVVMRLLVGWGVDGLITDDPELGLRIVQECGKSVY